jgi:TRAP-type mannitol/chloroaromatic compound transport system permease small subunit
VLGIPFGLLGIYSYSFERRRWSNSSRGTSGMPKTPLVLVVGGVVLLLTGIVVILKAIAESSSD